MKHYSVLRYNNDSVQTYYSKIKDKWQNIHRHR